MKRKLFHFALAAGVLLWLWAGSYIGFREYRSLTAFSPHATSCWIDLGTPVGRTVWIPKELGRLRAAYVPLAWVDERVTGVPVAVVVEHRFNFTIGYEF